MIHSKISATVIFSPFGESLHLEYYHTIARAISQAFRAAQEKTFPRIIFNNDVDKKTSEKFGGFSLIVILATAYTFIFDNFNQDTDITDGNDHG